MKLYLMTPITLKLPKTEVQLCIVHLVPHSLNYVGWKQRKEVAADLKLIYTAATEAKAELIQQAKRIGAKGWVVKPFKPDQLAAAVRKIVGH